MHDFISNDENFLNIEQPNIKKLIDGFKVLDVHFLKLNYEQSNNELFISAYNANQYQININNIITILKSIYKVDTDDYISCNYSLIMEFSDKPIGSYINSNINDYVTVLLSKAAEITDKEENVISLLNNEVLNNSLKLKYIENLKQF